ncbi:MAG: hypothetical protein LBG83_07590 [Oscillospiraceae bacterium]|jgi:hypothetical protein|nr:hypothetical protein [Oscillospiraceae bacterium]
MKRIAAIAACMALVVGLSACAGTPPPPPPQSFTARLTLGAGESAQQAALIQERPGVLRLEFSSPAPLAGFVLRLEGEAVTLDYGGMRANLPAGDLPQGGAAALLGQALAQLAQPAPKKSLHRLAGGGWERKGTANGQPYTARLGADGALFCLSAPGLELKAN